MREVTIHNAELADLVGQVQRTGEDVLLLLNGRPAARLAPASRLREGTSEARRSALIQIAEIKRAMADRQPDAAPETWDDVKSEARGEDRYDRWS